NFPKPTIAAINGHCFGGGLEIALACDFRIAASRAKLGQTEVNLGLVPGAGGSQRLVRVLGQAKAKELVFLGSRLTADEAATIGLVTKTVPNEAFAAEVRAFAEKLAKQAPIAIRLAKVLLNRRAVTCGSWTTSGTRLPPAIGSRSVKNSGSHSASVRSRNLAASVSAMAGRSGGSANCFPVSSGAPMSSHIRSQNFGSTVATES